MELPSLSKAVKTYRSISRFVYPYRSLLYLSIALTGLASLVGLGVPLVAKDLVNLVTGGRLPWGHIKEVLLLLGVLFVFQAIFSYIQVIVSAKFNLSLVRDVRAETFGHLLSLPVVYFEDKGSGDIASRISNDVTQFQYVFDSTLRTFVGGAINLIGSAIIMFILNWKLTLLTFTAVPLTLGVMLFFARIIRRLSRKMLDRVGSLSSQVQETTSGIETVKAFLGETEEMNKFGNVVDEIFSLGLKRAKYTALLSSFNQLLIWGTLVSVFTLGYWQVSIGAINAGEFVAFLLYAFKIVIPILSIAIVLGEFQKSLAAWERIKEILDSPSERWSGNFKTEKIRGDVELKGVCFEYSNGTNVLEDVSFKVASGEHVALVGPSGAGKSTVFALLLGFYHPVRGEILFDGVKMNDWDIKNLRSHIAYVPQDPMLFQGTLAENIAYAKPGATRAEIENAAKMADCLDFMDDFVNGLDTAVGERGENLSGGERQRVAIARAFLKNPSIILLDEATSSLDSLSEQRIHDSLSRLLKGRTAIVIAHRLSTVKNAQKIYVLSHGKITECGTHMQLFEKGGLYTQLCLVQELK